MLLLADPGLNEQLISQATDIAFPSSKNRNKYIVRIFFVLKFAQVCKTLEN